MANDGFDPEDFLDLKDVTPRVAPRDITPLVAPPVYTRRPAAPVRAGVTLEAEVQRPAPRRDDTPPPVAHPQTPRQPAQPIRHNIPGMTAAPAPRPPVPGFEAPCPQAPAAPATPPRPAVEHHIPGQLHPSARQPRAQTARGENVSQPIVHAIPAPRHPARAPIRHNIPGATEPTRAPIQRTVAGAAEPTRGPVRHTVPASPVQHHIPGQPRPAPAPVAQVFADPAPHFEAPRYDAPAPRAPQYPEDFPCAETLPEVLLAASVPARTAVQEHRGDHGGAVVHEPLAIAFRGQEYPAQSWTVHGFTLQDALPLEGSALGRVIDLTLLIGQGVTRIEMRVQARAESGDAADPRRFVFVDLDRARAEVLHRIVDHVVSNQALTLTQLLNETETDRHARRTTGGRTRRFLSGFRLLLAVIALLVAAGVTWNSVTSIASRYGAVTVEATSLSVPVPGTVTALAMAQGQAVAQGDVLGYVRPSDFDRRQSSMAERRQQLLDERADLLTRHDTMTQLAAISVTGADTDRTRIDQQLSLAQRRLDLEREQLAVLRAGGMPTAERQRERAAQEARVLQAETELLDTRARLDALVQVTVLAPLGVAGGDLRADTQTLDSVERRIDAVTAELDRIDALGINSDLGEPIVSPCDCVVQGIERRNGEWADPDQQLAVLVGAEAPTVHALVLSEEARKIAIGDRARIRLADGTTLQGRVQRMNYDPHWRGFAGLQDNVFAADRYARIEILPDQPLSAPVGMVATVTIQTSAIWGQMRALVGL